MLKMENTEAFIFYKSNTLTVVKPTMLHYITLETIYSGLSKSNFKDHYGDAAK